MVGDKSAVKPMVKTDVARRAIRYAIWLACWGFLIPAAVIALSVVSGHYLVTPFMFCLFALPVLGLVGLVAALWRWREHTGPVRLFLLPVRLFLLAVTGIAHWHLFGKGITKLLFGGMA